MMAIAAPTAAPSHAIKCWVDPNNLFFELSGQHGPTVLGFPRTADGFTRALAVLFVRHEVEGHGEVYHRPLTPASPIPDKNGITEQQRRDARDVLKKLGII